MAVSIPVIPPMWPAVKRDYPITPRENLMRALNHEKPLWMPILYDSSQAVISKCCQETPLNRKGDGYDWFGVFYKYSEAQSSTTPMHGMFDEIYDWKEKVKWPDLNAIDWSIERENFVRDENKALFMRFSNGPFERLHMFEGFEQALVDLMCEPEECREFFERVIDYKIELFNHLRDQFELDFIIAADDYGTERAPFFSTDLFEQTLLEPQKRFVKAVHDRGTKFIAHCCGKVDAFIPYFVDEIGVDGLEIQPINDVQKILRDYGDRVVVEYKVDPYLANDDEVKKDDIIKHVRQIVDTYGAHSNKGSGVVMNLQSRLEDIYYLM